MQIEIHPNSYIVLTFEQALSDEAKAAFKAALAKRMPEVSEDRIVVLDGGAKLSVITPSS